ncbi:methylated-DNA--[protein]-cysteine S-methyltransferase [Magnetovibrio blakemorei]|uniref:methylated-DNA--[protein]-cysteine S-methyltransferase n=1 Tax=Magnetovibrio blakemorei TaxID=28181 RepID=A0A1E5Q3S2_9PROT|nr:methylated-DNA--[protein]-cysteine S-methyltransferase [Magnetovibrio blakemorei]OEJ64432.1 hypothetical protein BEN30_16425 [Magnetovibrio blakemorei]
MSLQNDPDYTRIAAAIRFIAENRLEQPDLQDVARAIGLSPYHAQRVFTRWAGVSPKRFLSYLTLAHARELLARGESVMGTALDVGLSGPSRLHDLFVTFEAMTPGESQKGGRGLDISYCEVATPFGPAVLLKTLRGVCGFEFLGEGDTPKAIAEARWPGGTLQAVAPDERMVAQLFNRQPGSIALHVQGTQFQIRVWEALLKIAPGSATTYKRIAAQVGSPKGARAVGGAVGANPVGILIPCHRVIKETGIVEGYRWGSDRKRALLAWESCA